MTTPTVQSVVCQCPMHREAQPVTDEKPTCWRCGRVLFGKATRPWAIICQKCNAQNASPP